MRRKVSNSSHIPDDLTFSILSKLPIKSLTRFTCAQKSWSLLFQNPIFMDMFRTNFFFKSKQYEDDENTHLLLKQTKLICIQDSLCILSGETFEDRVSLDWPPPFQDNDNDVKILGFSSVNGILCLCQGYGCDYKTVLWNPATGDFKVIPLSYQPEECNCPPQGFGYDRVRDDYKVIRIAEYPNMVFEGNWVWLPEKDSQLWEMSELLDRVLDEDDEFWEGWAVHMYDPFWEIYCLKSNSWRKLECPGMPDPLNELLGGFDHVNLNEFCHWLMPQDYMLSFDFSNEIFFSTNLPSESDILPPRTLRERNLVVLNGSILLIVNEFVTAPFHIWILGELGVKESWTKFFVLGPLTFSVMRPIGGGKKSHIFIRKEDNELAWFDFSTQRIGEVAAKGDLLCMQIITYKENLLSFLE